MDGGKCRRGNKRLDVSGDDDFRIEFGYPDPDGKQCRMSLRDISQAGVSFVLNQELPNVEIGQMIDRAVVHLGKRKLNGDLVIAHLSDHRVEGTVCGALLYPSTDNDLIKLKSTVADLLTA